MGSDTQFQKPDIILEAVTIFNRVYLTIGKSEIRVRSEKKNGHVGVLVFI